MSGLAAIAIAMLVGLGCVWAEAQEPAATPSPAPAAAPAAGIDPKALAYFAAGIGAGLTIMGGAAGIGRLAAAAMEGIARQPNAAGDIRGAMIVAAGLIEGVTFFALIVTTLLVVFV